MWTDRRDPERRGSAVYKAADKRAKRPRGEGSAGIRSPIAAQVDTCRTAVVWTVELTIYYGFGHSKYGEPWDKTSVIQLVGFFIMAIGTFTYYRVFDWPVAALYPPPEKPEPEVHYEPLADDDARNPLPMTARRDDSRDV